MFGEDKGQGGRAIGSKEMGGGKRGQRGTEECGADGLVEHHVDEKCHLPCRKQRMLQPSGHQPLQRPLTVP